MTWSMPNLKDGLETARPRRIFDEQQLRYYPPGYPQRTR